MLVAKTTTLTLTWVIPVTGTASNFSVDTPDGSGNTILGNTELQRIDHSTPEKKKTTINNTGLSITNSTTTTVGIITIDVTTPSSSGSYEYILHRLVPGSIKIKHVLGSHVIHIPALETSSSTDIPTTQVV